MDCLLDAVSHSMLGRVGSYCCLWLKLPLTAAFAVARITITTICTLAHCVQRIATGTTLRIATTTMAGGFISVVTKTDNSCCLAINNKY